MSLNLRFVRITNRFACIDQSFVSYNNGFYSNGANDEILVTPVHKLRKLAHKAFSRYVVSIQCCLHIENQMLLWMEFWCLLFGCFSLLMNARIIKMQCAWVVLQKSVVLEIENNVDRI